MNEINILESTYHDTMTIYRNTYKENEFGVSEDRKNLIAKDIKCALSKKDLPTIGEETNLVTTYMIFCNPETDIQAGDILEVIAQGLEYELIVGDMFKYPSHIEVAVNKKVRI